MAKKRGKSIIRWFTAGFFILMFILATGLLMVAAEHTFMNYYIWFAVMALLGVVSVMHASVALGHRWRGPLVVWCASCGVFHCVFIRVADRAEFYAYRLQRFARS